MTIVISRILDAQLLLIMIAKHLCLILDLDYGLYCMLVIWEGGGGYNELN